MTTSDIGQSPNNKAVDAAINTALTDLARSHAGRVLAILARRFSDLDVADEAVQEALIEAARTWPERGIPANPPAWLMSVAGRKAIDQKRRAASARRRTNNAAAELIADYEERASVTTPNESSASNMISEPQTTETETNTTADDDQLRLVLLCCHPALDRDAQVALTLRLVGGLTTGEIAAGFLVPEATLAQRIVRAKRKIRDAAIPLSLPDQLEKRLDPVLTVLYLIFNEGYLARNGHDAVMRLDLVDEAIRLTRLVASLPTQSAEPQGLLALELFHRSRAATRTDSNGDLVLLDKQDRSKWDLPTIGEANRVVTHMMLLRQPGPYQVQALIAAYHANAKTAEETNWPVIVSLYQQLMAMDPSPVVALNHAVAVAMAEGPLEGLTLVDQLTSLHAYYLWHSTRAELLFRAGRSEDAASEFSEALQLTDNPAEQRHLQRRLDLVSSAA